MDLGKGPLEVFEQGFVEFDAQLGVNAALEENAGATCGDRLRNLGRNLIELKNVGILVIKSSVEGTEAATVDANVGVIDVAINDVGGNAVWPSSSKPPWSKMTWIWRPSRRCPSAALSRMESTNTGITPHNNVERPGVPGSRLYGFTALRLYGETIRPGAGVVNSMCHIAVLPYSRLPV